MTSRLRDILLFKGRMKRSAFMLTVVALVVIYAVATAVLITPHIYLHDAPVQFLIYMAISYTSSCIFAAVLAARLRDVRGPWILPVLALIALTVQEALGLYEFFTTTSIAEFSLGYGIWAIALNPATHIILFVICAFWTFRTSNPVAGTQI